MPADVSAEVGPSLVRETRSHGPTPTARVAIAPTSADADADTVIELAQHFAAGRLSTPALLSAPDADVLNALTAVRGIGRWTVDMFLIFTLRRPDVLPVGDLGVQKGLLRWVLAAHGALPAPKTPTKKAPSTPAKTAQPTEPPTPATPATPATPRRSLAGDSSATLLNEPATPAPGGSSLLPTTPGPPPATPSADTDPALPPPVADESLIAVPEDWGPDHAARAAPLPPWLDVATLRSRLAGNKAK